MILARVATLRRTSAAYRYLSAWARGPHTAGPLLWLSMRNWMPVASIARPISPPNASTSRTICPLASPPTAGLHDICPTRWGSSVTSATRAPIPAAAHAASAPACPPPITITSYADAPLLAPLMPDTIAAGHGRRHAAA